MNTKKQKDVSVYETRKSSGVLAILVDVCYY